MFGWTDLIIAATIGCTLSGILWGGAAWISLRRLKGSYTVVLQLHEHESELTVHQVSYCGSTHEALIKAAAEKLGGVSLRQAKEHIGTKPYGAFVFAGHFPYIKY